MKSRTAALALVALVSGIVVLARTDNLLLVLAGLLLLGGGVLGVLVALLRGVSDSSDASHRAAASDAHRASEDGKHLKTRSETGRWPPIIGGG